MLEQRYDRITVQAIINRADVGRSTFYAHFRDQEAVLTGEFERVLDALHGPLEPDGAAGERLAVLVEGGAPTVPLTIRADHLAGTFFGLLRW